MVMDGTRIDIVINRSPGASGPTHQWCVTQLDMAADTPGAVRELVTDLLNGKYGYSPATSPARPRKTSHEPGEPRHQRRDLESAEERPPSKTGHRHARSVFRTCAAVTGTAQAATTPQMRVPGSWSGRSSRRVTSGESGTRCPTTMASWWRTTTPSSTAPRSST